MKSFEIIHHQRAIRFYSTDEDKWLGFKFDSPTWERLIEELNNPPDLGVEVADAVKAEEEISGS